MSHTIFILYTMSLLTVLTLASKTSRGADGAPGERPAGRCPFQKFAALVQDKPSNPSPSAFSLTLAESPKPIPDAVPGSGAAGVVGDYLKMKLDELLRFKDRGPVVRLGQDPQTGKTFYFVSDPEAVQGILKSTKTLADVPQERASSSVAKGVMNIVGGDLFFGNGAAWRNRRKLLDDLFTYRVSEGKLPAINESTERLINGRWQKFAESGQPVDLLEEMNRFMFESFLTSYAGMKGDGRMATVFEKFRYFFRRINEGKLSSPQQARAELPKILAARREVDAINRQILAERRALGFPDSDNIFDRLGKALDEHGKPLAEDKILGELRTLYVATTDTTAWLMSKSLDNVIQHPDKGAKLIKEITEVAGSGEITPEKLAQMPYLDAFLNEVLRDSPSLNTLSSSFTKDVNVMGHTIPANSTLIYSTEALQHDPAGWVNPGQFLPERFLGTKMPASHKGYLMPFGGGERICLGRTFAMKAAATGLASILRRFQVVPAVRGTSLVEVRPSLIRTTGSDAPHMVKFVARRN